MHLRRRGVLMETRPAMEGQRVAITHNHRLIVMEEMMTMVTVHHQTLMEKKVAVMLDLDLMGIVEMLMKETGKRDLGGLTLLPILRRVGVRVKSKVEGIRSLIGCWGV